MQKAQISLFQPRRTRRGIGNLVILFLLADLRVLRGEITPRCILLDFPDNHVKSCCAICSGPLTAA